MKDEVILLKVQKILDIMHNPETGFINRNLDIERLANNREERPIDTKFSLTGKEIFKNQLGKAVGCTGVAKVFLHLVDKNTLDVIGVVTTALEAYSKGVGNSGHVIVAVKLNDKKYHMFDPGKKNLKLFGTTPKIGKVIYHELLLRIKEKPYVITAITKDLEQIKSFENIKNISLSGNVNSDKLLFNKKKLETKNLLNKTKNLFKKKINLFSRNKERE